MPALRAVKRITVHPTVLKTLLAGAVLTFLVAFPSHAKYETLIREIHPHPRTLSESRPQNLSREIIKQSKTYSIPDEIMVAVIWQETNFRSIKSKVQTEESCGYGQVHVDTAEMLHGKPLTCDQLKKSWRLNIKLTARYLAKMRERTGHLAGAIGRYNGQHNLDYVHDVLKKRQRVLNYLSDQ